MKKLLLAIPFFLVSAKAFSVDCPKAKVRNVQPQPGAILFRLEGQDWHRLGKPGDPGVSEMYSALLAVHMAGKEIVVRYPDGYDCSAYNLTVNAQMVRTYP